MPILSVKQDSFKQIRQPPWNMTFSSFCFCYVFLCALVWIRCSCSWKASVFVNVAMETKDHAPHLIVIIDLEMDASHWVLNYASKKYLMWALYSLAETHPCFSYGHLSVRTTWFVPRKYLVTYHNKTNMQRVRWKNLSLQCESHNFVHSNTSEPTIWRGAWHKTCYAGNKLSLCLFPLGHVNCLKFHSHSCTSGKCCAIRQTRPADDTENLYDEGTSHKCLLKINCHDKIWQHPQP